MIFTSILKLLVAKALPSINKKISSIKRISPIILKYPGVLSLNTLYIQSIGSGIGIYSGLFLISILFCETCLFFIPYFLVLNFLFLNHLYLISNNYTTKSSTCSTTILTNFNIFYFSTLSLRSTINRPLNRFNYSISTNTNYKLNKDLRKFIGGGYSSYKNVISLGFLNDLLDNKPLFLKKLFNYLANLENNKCFTLLPVIRWIDDDTGFSQSITISHSIKITKFVDIDLLAERLTDSMIKAMNRYEVNNCNSELVLMNRV